MVHRPSTSQRAARSSLARKRGGTPAAGKKASQMAAKATGKAVGRAKAPPPHQITIFEYAAAIGVKLLPEAS